MLQSPIFSEPKVQHTLKLITRGRLTGLPHITELRYVGLGESIYVLAGSSKSDWVLNALALKDVKVKLEETIWPVSAYVGSSIEKDRVVDSFRQKYGARVVDQWYRNSQLCLRFSLAGSPIIRGAVRGETETVTNFSQWKQSGLEYYRSVEEAFDSASEEYDYTISHNYINSWIRKRSITELLNLTRSSDVLLEIGCGTGAETIQVSKRVAGIVATDISEKMLHILKRKVFAKKRDTKIIALRARASEISTVQSFLPKGKVRIAYSFNGALNCEPELDKVPEQLSTIIENDGYFVCSIRNTLCLPETVSHSIVFQFDKTNKRKTQPIMVSVGGIDIPSYYYSPSRFANIFQPYFRTKKIIGLPAFLPPAYLNEYYLRTGMMKPLIEKLELTLGRLFPFNRFGDQTLFVFQKI